MSVVKVYRYGLLAPTENRDLVAQTMRLAHEYRNKLVEIDRQERAEIRALQTSHGSIPALEAAAKAAIQAKEAAYAAIRPINDPPAVARCLFGDPVGALAA